MGQGMFYLTATFLPPLNLCMKAYIAIKKFDACTQAKCMSHEAFIYIEMDLQTFQGHTHYVTHDWIIFKVGWW